MPLAKISLRTGFEHLRSKRLDRAKEAFELLTARARNDRTRIDAMIGLALTHRGIGEYNRSIELLTKVLELDPDNSVANFDLANLYSEMGQYMLAVQAYGRVIALDPANMDAHNNRGISWYNIGKIDEALKDFTTVMEMSVNNHRALINSGVCHIDEGRYENAIDLFDSVLEKDHDNVNALLGKGLALFYMDRYDDSIICFEAATSIKPDFYVAYYFKASIFRKLDLLDDAETAIREALEIRKDYAKGYFELGKILRAKGDIERAIGSYENASRLSHGVYEEALFEIGRIHLEEKKDPVTALRYFKEIISANPYIPQVWYETGQAFGALGTDLPKAKKAFENAIHLGLDDLGTRRALAEVHLTLGDNISAAKVLGEIVQRFPDAGSHMLLSKVNFTVGEYSDAIDEADQAISLDPGLNEALLWMGRSYGALGKVEEYKQCLRRYLNSVPTEERIRAELGSLG